METAIPCKQTFNMRLFLGGGKPNFIKSDFSDFFFFQLLRDYKNDHILSMDVSDKQTGRRDFPYPMSGESVSDQKSVQTWAQGSYGENQRDDPLG